LPPCGRVSGVWGVSRSRTRVTLGRIRRNDGVRLLENHTRALRRVGAWTSRHSHKKARASAPTASVYSPASPIPLGTTRNTTAGSGPLRTQHHQRCKHDRKILLAVTVVVLKVVALVFQGVKLPIRSINFLFPEFQAAYRAQFLTLAVAEYPPGPPTGGVSRRRISSPAACLMIVSRNVRKCFQDPLCCWLVGHLVLVLWVQTGEASLLGLKRPSQDKLRDREHPDPEPSAGT